METVRVLSSKRQVFLGIVYTLDSAGRYFSRGKRRLHRVVWEHFNGPIPAGQHVHHIDENRAHNQIGNLQLLAAKSHLSEHMRQPGRKRKASDALAKVARIAASAWHRSSEGRAEHARMYRDGGGEKLHAKRREFKCRICGKAMFSNRTERHYFCSKACKSEQRRRDGVDDVTRPCLHCGELFTRNKYLKRNFCSRGCATRHRSTAD